MDIKKIPEAERPREKLLRLGAKALSDSELLAVILASGTREKPVMELARSIVEIDDSGILFLADCVPEELSRISGIGKAKSCQLAASIELGKRIASRPKSGRYVISHSADAANYVMEELRHLKHEVFMVMAISSSGEITAFDKIAEGALNSAGIWARELFSTAVRRNAYALILVHNHPSGNPEPSRADIETTNRLIDAGKILGIPVMDHIIIGNGTYYSFKEHKLF